MELALSTLLKLGSFLFWSGLYIYTVVNTAQGPEWCSRAVTLLHGTVATVVGLLQCGPFTLTACSFTTCITTQQYALMIWSWGYFAFDLLWCLMYWSDNCLMLLHHVSALGAISVYMRKENTGCTFPCSLAILEITNPLLQIRWFLRHTGYDKTIIFKLIEIIYLVSFLTIRAGLGTYLTYKFVMAEYFDVESKIVSVLMYFISLGLVYEIVGFVYYKYRTKIEEFQGVLEEMGLVLNDEM